MKFLLNFARKSKKGQGLVEYALILGFLSLGTIGALVTIAPKLSELFEYLPAYF